MPCVSWSSSSSAVYEPPDRLNRSLTAEVTNFSVTLRTGALDGRKGLDLTYS